MAEPTAVVVAPEEAVTSGARRTAPAEVTVLLTAPVAVATGMVQFSVACWLPPAARPVKRESQSSSSVRL